MWPWNPKDHDDDLKVLIERMIDDLSKPVTEDERSEGWDIALKIRWHDWFVELDSSIVAGKDIPAGWGIARAMDFDGVGLTPISSKASKIGRLLDQGIRYC